MAIDDLEGRLRKVQENFIAALPERIAEVAGLWDSPGPDLLPRVHKALHRLAGGAGTLGQPDLGAGTKALELEVQALIESGAEPGPEDLAELARRTRALADLVRSGLP